MARTFTDLAPGRTAVIPAESLQLRLGSALIAVSAASLVIIVIVQCLYAALGS